MDVSLSGLRELVMDREARRASSLLHRVAKSWTRLSGWAELNWTEKKQALDTWFPLGAHVISRGGPRDCSWGPTWFPLGAHVISRGGPLDFAWGPTWLPQRAHVIVHGGPQRFQKTRCLLSSTPSLLPCSTLRSVHWETRRWRILWRKCGIIHFLRKGSNLHEKKFFRKSL